MNIVLENATQEILESFASSENLGSISVSELDFPLDDTPESRWNQMVLASRGVRLWSNTDHRLSPLYAGGLPKDEREVELIIVDAKYAQARVEHYAKFKVNYIGRIDVDPRNLLVLDHKKKPAERHDVYLSDPLRAIMAASPTEWWGSLGIVSASTPDRLSAFLDLLYDAIPLAFTNSSEAKLKFAGRDYVRLDTPKANIKYGVEMREKAYNLSRERADGYMD